MQRVLFAALAPLGRALGYNAIYPQYVKPHGQATPDPRALAAAGLPPI